MVFLVNTSTYANHAAFNFARVNKPVGKFYEVPAKFHLTNARQQCDIRYDHLSLPSSLADRSGEPDGAIQLEHTVGVVRYRPVYGKGVYKVHDFMEGARPTTWGKMCHNCSNNFQCPIWHTRDDTTCPGEGIWHPAGRANIVQPDPARISGLQNNRTRLLALKKPPGAFPCLSTVQGEPCAHSYYKTAGPANTHMKKAHLQELATKLIELYPTAKKTVVSAVILGYYIPCFLMRTPLSSANKAESWPV
jgi:hypothetical protein